MRHHAPGVLTSNVNPAAAKGEMSSSASVHPMIARPRHPGQWTRPGLAAAAARHVCDHRVQFYDSDDYLIRRLVDHLLPALHAGHAAVLIATEPHLERVRDRLADLPAELAQRLIFRDAGASLARFMVDGLPDPARFEVFVGELLAQADAAGANGVSAFGEMVALLYADGRSDAAARLEQLWDGLIDRHGFSLLCAYPMGAFPDESHRPAFAAICDAHRHVEPLERCDAAAKDSPDIDAMHRLIARLQQQANALDLAVQRRSAADLCVAAQTDRLRAMAAAQAALEQLAGRDALTGLPNRRGFDERLAQALAKAGRSGSRTALAFVDLDNFKQFNDRCGHPAGDRLLQVVAQALRRSARAGDTVCRIGGDEFTVIMEGTDRAEAGRLVARIDKALGALSLPGGRALGLSASVGLAVHPDEAADAEALVRDSDRAMYAVKRSRHGGVARPGGDIDCGSDRAAVVDEPPVLSLEAVATQLRVTRPHVLKLMREHRLATVRSAGAGTPMVAGADFQRLAEIVRLRGPG